MRKYIVSGLMFLTFSAAVSGIAAGTPQSQGRAAGLEPELQQAIEHINLSFQLLAREQDTLKKYIQFLLETIVEKDKKNEKLKAELKEKESKTKK